MGVRNYLVEGLSGTGKTSVCRELQRRGFHAVNGDTELAYQGDPVTGAPTAIASHWHHLWDVARVRALIADRSEPITFLCGGSRNVAAFVDLLDAVFVLEVDARTLGARLDRRPPDEFGGTPDQRAFVLQLHHDGTDVPDGVRIDARPELGVVVDAILAGCGLEGFASSPHEPR